MNPRYPRIAARARHRCEYCLAPEAAFNFAFEVEHIFPASDLGADDESNLALACRSCNAFKAAATTGVEPDTNEVARLFHPRWDDWHEHFRVDPETGMIVGLNAIGRATVSRLRLNHPRQSSARRLWMQLGLFP